MWADRTEAGRELGEELAGRGYAGRYDTVVLGVPRGGVEVARVVADRIGAPLGVVIARKVGAPGNPEYAAGAVDLDGTLSVNPDAGYGAADLREAAAAEHAEALRRLEEYRQGRPEPRLEGRIVIVVDDGIATGLTAIAALGWLRERGAARVVLAVPVMPPDTRDRLAKLCDEVVVLSTPDGFRAVGEFYRSFPQLTDERVKELLAAG